MPPSASWKSRSIDRPLSGIFSENGTVRIGRRVCGGRPAGFLDTKSGKEMRHRIFSPDVFSKKGMPLDVVFRKRAPVGRTAEGALPFGKRTGGGGDGSASERQGVRGLWRGGQGRVGGFFGMHVSRRRDGKGGVVSLRAIRRLCGFRCSADGCSGAKGWGNGRARTADAFRKRRMFRSKSVSAGAGGGRKLAGCGCGRALPAFLRYGRSVCVS